MKRASDVIIFIIKSLARIGAGGTAATVKRADVRGLQPCKQSVDLFPAPERLGRPS